MNAQSQKVSERVGQLFQADVNGIAKHIEEPARAYFGGSHGLLDDTEITEISFELEHLFGEFLGCEDPLSTESPAYEALQGFFVNLAKKILSRGGDIDNLVRYTQSLQRALIAAVEEVNDIPFTRSRSVLAFVSERFTELMLVIFRTYLNQKDATIQAQEDELREKATPITEIWQGVIALPLIGTLDSSRAMLIMDSLLNRIANHKVKVVVMDLTGVGSIDSQVSHHLIHMVRAVKLMGAEAVLTGISPEIARALTQLEIDLGEVRTRSNLADGLSDAFKHIGVKVVPIDGS
ncbi:RsbR [Halorhodospira halochloris]|uniref:RsbR n=1 Tax=Halorhodospira halochloris TaxID=1052 RepID=A0A125T2Q2_HALHR|nr:STAS domain-containing protein [Halorhodospira halochloris]MBK1652217.1 hypothetical protein [Halorhodospira halochloris]BAU58361.1 RsbR [Halorhodospira halochloris]